MRNDMRDFEMKKTVTSQCHCGSVELKLYLPNGFEKLRRCNCSICRRKGAIVASVLLDNLIIVKGEEYLTEYRFNTNTAKHYFCSKCGIYTHHQRRSNPNEYGFNTGCVDEFKPEDYLEIPVVDGINHPKDIIGESSSI